MPFQLPNQTSFALEKPTYSGSTWVRPFDWITITDTPNEVQFLVSDVVYPVYAIQTIFTQTGGVGNIYIDWGDGIIDTISTTAITTTNHTYTTGGTPSTQGYNTWKIRIYGDVGTTIYGAQQVSNTTYWGNTILGQAGTLEAVYGDGTIGEINLTTYFSANNILRQNFLQYIKLPSTIISVSFNSTFRDLTALQKIVMPTSAANINATQDTFNGCIMLKEVVLPYDMVNVSTMSSMFNGCRSLQNVVFPANLNNAQGIGGMFNGCFSLGSVQLPETNICYGFDSLFQNCFSLLNVEIKSWGQGVYSGGTTMNLNNMFSGCRTLEDVKLPQTLAFGTQTQVASMFLDCRSLKSFTTFPTNFNCDSMSSMFFNCYSLSKVILPPTIPLLNNLTNTFNGCGQLAEITLPETSAATINLTNTFTNCVGLTEVVIPNSYVVNNYQALVQSCFSLKKLTLSPVFSGGTSMLNMCSDCPSLEEVIMPTTIVGATNFGGIFNGCLNLKSPITFPSSLTTMSQVNTMFFNCNSLTSVVLPPNATYTSLQQIFGAAKSIKTITLSSNPGAGITTYLSAFIGCNSVETITLPPVPSPSLVANATNNMFNQVENLTTLNNEEFLGNSGTTSTIYHDGTNFLTRAPRLQSLDLRCKWSKFQAAGVATLFNGLTSLRLRNNGSGQYAGTAPQIDIKYNKLGQAALVQLFNDLPTISAKSIDITSNPGAALLTPAERAIATGKGWTIIG